MSVKLPNKIQFDDWIWGREQILWGFDPSHKFTFKVLEPKPGRDGCLSLQYHHHKSECWFVLRGVAWALVGIEDQVATRIMRPNDLQQLPAGIVHRLMGVSDDVQILEPSTPDAHAADKSIKKDVIRLHCVHGRECDSPADDSQTKMLATAIEYTEEAIAAIEAGKEPPEHNRELLDDYGALSL